jgi:glutamate-ammonia-ligase adenylyltransferase
VDEIDVSNDLTFQFDEIIKLSPYIARVFQTKPFLIEELIKEGGFEKRRTRDDYLSIFHQIESLPEIPYQKALRETRHREMCRIAYRALHAKSELPETLEETSDFADVCLLSVNDYLYKNLEKKYGTPRDSSGQVQSLHVIALGKLGGRELNFSSDIDIFFTFPEETTSLDEKTGMTGSIFFTRLAQSMVKYISQSTPDGFVFRVDLRLRPHGQSGPLVMSFSSLETYYQEQGRDWERYAMMKARVLTTNTLHAKRLHQIFHPFVYRRYVDFSALESLRALKQLIERELKLKLLSDDIKRGPGGIREIEFIVQSLQLTHGGRDKSLQTHQLRTGLESIQARALLSFSACEGLKKAYIFLRRVENAIQMYDDRQTHALPTTPEAELALVYALQKTNFDVLLHELNVHRAFVVAQFKQVLNDQKTLYQDDKKILEKQLLALWQGHLGDVPSEDVLLSLGFSDPENAYQRLNKFANSKRCQRLSQLARLRLDKFMPLLLSKCQGYDSVDIVFVRVLRLLEGIIKRSAYLALLIENPVSLQHLLTLFSLSPWISEQVSEQPFLLEVLLDTTLLYQPLSEKELSDTLNREMKALTETEEKMEVLRQFKLKQLLVLAAAYLTNSLGADLVGEHLSNTATVVINKVLSIALDESFSKNDLDVVKDNFAIIAYGKLGSRDLNFQSDLDLVFLHECPESLEPKVIRLAQRILNLLSTRMMGGVLYRVDTRLRPSGQAGLLVSEINAFETYQCKNAWTWEHQALVKARWLAGSQTIKQRFKSLRKKVLTQARDKEKLYKDIHDMRQKMKGNYKPKMSDSLKEGEGGLVDLEFMMQYAVLRFAHQYPNLCLQTETKALIEILKNTEIISLNEASELDRHYRLLLDLLHAQVLKTDEGARKKAALEKGAYLIQTVYDRLHRA